MLAVAVLLAACSSGDDEGSATTTSSPPPRSSSTTAPPDYTGDPASPFCALLRDVDPGNVLAGDSADPASVEEAFGRLVDVLGQASAAAPPEIEADVALVAAGVDALDGALAEVDYDFEALAASGDAAEVTEAVNDPVFTDAGVRLAAYRSQVCGL